MGRESVSNTMEATRRSFGESGIESAQISNLHDMNLCLVIPMLSLRENKNKKQ